MDILFDLVMVAAVAYVCLNRSANKEDIKHIDIGDDSGTGRVFAYLLACLTAFVFVCADVLGWALA